MKRIFLFVFIMQSIFGFAQEKNQIMSFTSDGGKTFDVGIQSNDPDDVRKGEVYFGVFGIDGIHILGANYYVPKVGFLNTGINAGNVWVDGSVTPLSTKLAGKMGVKVGYEGDKKYVAKVPYERRLSLGLHGGFNQYRFLLSKSGTTRLEGKSFAAGITVMSAKFLKWGVSEDGNPPNFFRQGSMLVRLNIDYVGYFDQSASTISKSDPILPYPTSYYARESGFRAYFEGKVTVSSTKGIFGFHYMLGVAQGAEKLKDFDVLAGLGLSFSIN